MEHLHPLTASLTLGLRRLLILMVPLADLRPQSVFSGRHSRTQNGHTLKQVGELLLGAIPTIVILLLLYAIYNLLVRRPLMRILDERRERTEGVVLKARADVAAAEAKTQDYEERLREARLVSTRPRKRAGSRHNRPARRLWQRRATGRTSKFAKPRLPSSRTWPRRAAGCRAKWRDWRPRSYVRF